MCTENDKTTDAVEHKSELTCSVSKRDCWNKCDVCGKFIPYSDIESGRGVHRMITPDSDLSCESFETLCAEHTPNK
jgi:hypothetical protein